VAGATATYVDVLPEVDLRLTATSTGMTEVFIIHSPEAAQNPDLLSLKIGVSGATVEQQADGSTTAVAEGQPAEVAVSADLRSNRPQAWDSSHAESDADGPGGAAGAVPVPVETAADGVVLDVDAVVDAEVTYPLFIDPDWSGGQIHAWYVAQTYPNQAYVDGGAYTDGNQQMGFIAGAYSADGLNQLVRAFWEMPTSAVAGKTILAAAFNTTLVWGFNCTASPMQLWRVTGAPVGGTWNNTAGASWVQNLDNKNIAAGRSGCPATAVGFNVQAGVAAVAAEGGSSITLGMRASDEGSSSGWKRWAVGAQLIITYNTTPTAAMTSVGTKTCAQTATAPSYHNGTQALALPASVVDADGGNVSTRFYVEQATGSVANWASPTNALPTTLAPNGYLATASQAQGIQTASIPANTLTPGHYRVSARAFDGLATSSTTPWCYFEIKNSLSALPGVTEVAAGPYTVGQPTTLRFTSNPADAVAAFAYWWAYTTTTSPTPAVPVTISGTPTCGSGSGPVRFTCPDSTGVSSLITVAPVAQTSTLWVAAVDAAGNIAQIGPATATPVTYLAGPDTTNVDFTTGHGWDTQSALSPLGATIQDANTNTPRPLVLGNDVSRTSTDEVQAGEGAQPVLSYGAMAFLVTWWAKDPRSGNPTYKFTTLGENPPTASTFAQSAGWIVRADQPQPANTQSLFRCATDASGTAWYLTTTPTAAPTSTQPACVSSKKIGYLRTSGAVSDLVKDCIDSSYPTRHFAYPGSCPPNSSGVSNLGYGFNLGLANPVQRTGGNPAVPTIDTRLSATLSAWLKPADSVGSMTAISQVGQNYYGMALGVSSDNRWQFCYRQQVVDKTTCAYGPTVVPGQWQYVVGVRDAVNEEIRIYVGDTSLASGAARLFVASGETSANSDFYVGSSRSQKGPVDLWRGMIASPTVFPGVADRVQRQNLYYQYPPN
jgi:hypothetical protein